MQSFAWLGAALLATAIGTSTVSAEPSRRETLRMEATAASLQAATDGVAWRCAADGCVGLAPRRAVDLMAECRSVSEAMGPVATYQRGALALSPAQVHACNRLAGHSGYSLTSERR